MKSFSRTDSMRDLLVAWRAIRRINTKLTSSGRMPIVQDKFRNASRVSVAKTVRYGVLSVPPSSPRWNGSASSKAPNDVTEFPFLNAQYICIHSKSEAPQPYLLKLYTYQCEVNRD